MLKDISSLSSFIGIMLFISCGVKGPEPIILNKDECSNCKMPVSDKRYGCELITEKGRVYKFDDLSCLINYQKTNRDKTINAQVFVSDFLAPNELTHLKELTFIRGEDMGSPMGGNIAAFSNKDSASFYLTKWKAESTTWDSLIR